MSTLNKYAYDLAETVGKENDYGFLERMKFHVLNYRSMFFRRDQSRNNRLPDSFVQSLGCLPMVQVPSVECCGVDLGCKIYRTKSKVPVPIRLKNGNAFTYVGTIDGGNSYAQATRQEAAYRSFDRFKGKSQYYVWENGYIYVFNTKPEAILVKGVFEDPRQVKELGLCDGECYDDNKPFPMPNDMGPGLLLAIKREVLAQPADENQKIEVDEKKA